MSESNLVRFNTNHYVRVKFSPASLDLWRENAEKMRAAFPSMPHLFPLAPPLDSEGFYRGQFWAVMHLVAPNLVAGGSAFEGCLIYLENATLMPRELDREPPSDDKPLK